MLRRALAPAVAVALIVALAGCKREDMAAQPKASVWGQSNFFARAMVMRHPVAGTVARDAPDAPVPQPATITAAMLRRGRAAFAANCVPCHDAAGTGHGTIVARGFPPPPAYDSPKVRQASAQTLYDVITEGRGAMYGFGNWIEPATRWDLVAYVRALQLSQSAAAAALSPADRAHLNAAGRNAG